MQFLVTMPGQQADVPVRYTMSLSNVRAIDESWNQVYVTTYVE